MTLGSCANCCFNGMQYGSVGLSVGYCVEHRAVLRRADEMTCGRQFRKDLAGPSAEKDQAAHEMLFLRDRIVTLREHHDVSDHDEYVEHEPGSLLGDPVGEASAEYGLDASKIQSLASLSRLPGVRPELAWTSLGRVYVRRCVSRGGQWTSGVHMLWWLKRRLADDPLIAVTDLRYQTRASFARQQELAMWSVMMLRLTLIGDVGVQASRAGDAVGAVETFPEEAAAEASTSYRKLKRWVSGRAKPTLERVLPWARYTQLYDELHK